tara:strand:- start:557 stop:859 length:303 start_codon:yes stop_codon:yes gene_type:complete
MKIENNTIVTIKTLLIILFSLCLFDWQYGFYQFVRFFGMIGFGILAYNEYEKNTNLFLIWISSLILINPFFKVVLGREIWNIVDVVWVIIIIYSLFKKKI